MIDRYLTDANVLQYLMELSRDEKVLMITAYCKVLED